MSDNNTVVLETAGLSKYYGKARGILDVDLEVKKSEIFGFIGPNGAGKSTTIRTILGLIFPDSGSVRLFGQDGLKNSACLRKRIGFVPSEVNYYESLNVKQLLQYSADFYGRAGRKKINSYCERMMLDLNRNIADLSLGNRKKVGLVQALLRSPELLILDEPTSGLDPLIQSRYFEILREEQARGCTVFFSSHTLSEVERLCSRVAIIKDGRIVKTSEIEELRKMSMKRFRLIYNRGVSPGDFTINGARKVKLTARAAEGLYSGDIKELLIQLSGLPVEDIVIEDPNLEEIFMHYYAGEGGAL